MLPGMWYFIPDIRCVARNVVPYTLFTVCHHECGTIYLIYGVMPGIGTIYLIYGALPGVWNYIPDIWCVSIVLVLYI